MMPPAMMLMQGPMVAATFQLAWKARPPLKVRKKLS